MTITLDQCRAIYDEATKKQTPKFSKGNLDAALRYLNASDTQGFARVCRGDSFFKVPNGAAYSIADSDGDYESWHEYGKLKHYYSVIAGLKHGFARRWRPNGELWEVYRYKQGLRHGLYVLFYENGSPSEMALYKKDTLHGLREKYNEDASLLERSYYKRGVLVKGTP